MDLDRALGDATGPIDGLKGDALVEAATLRYLQEIEADPAIVTGWVVVAEYMNADGVPTLLPFAATGMPYWKINGMLDAAREEMIYDDGDDE